MSKNRRENRRPKKSYDDRGKCNLGFYNFNDFMAITRMSNVTDSQVCTMVWTSVSYDGKASLRIIDRGVKVDCLDCV